MSWIDKILPSGVRKDDTAKRASVPEGLWKKCIKCDSVLYRPDLERNQDVCPKCDHHMRIGARQRLDFFLDKIKNKFGTGWFWVQIYLFIFWIFGGEFIAFGYLLTCLTE